ncbi:hypothetical protein ABZX88_02190 [Kitasatospora aureofaciens]|uniref:hypothetical protein n=1 Tax=Kitasatospora aureofaciens TaxID=1894 RepID=UPI00131E52D4|nr:hypothetical protein [Kitasatospora aureofaciens]
MAVNPELQAELDRLGRSLRERLVELITELTPGADLTALFLDVPTVVEWREPPLYHYAALFRGMRPSEVPAAELAARAAALLGAAGWEVRTWREESEGRPVCMVGGSRERVTLKVRTGDHTSSVMFEGETPALPLSEPREFQWPEPIRTEETVTPGFVLCYECDGLGACSYCGGRGWSLGGDGLRHGCRGCDRRRYCLICRGAGQLAFSELSPYQLGYYRDRDPG